MAPKKNKYLCNNKINENTCGGTVSITHEDGIPVFVCDVCSHKDLTWKRFYSDYLLLYKQKDNWLVEKNYVSCIIGQFCAEYKKRYGVDYTFVPKNPNPFSAKECKDAWIMLAAFGKNSIETRRYIIWAFNRGIGSNAKITSLAYLNTPNLIRRYKLWAQTKDILKRNSKLPSAFLDWCKQNAPEISNQYTLETMNDLGALLNYANAYADLSSVESQVINQATTLGLIKNNKLNIGI